MADTTEAEPAGTAADSVGEEVRRREGSWAPLLGAVVIVLLALVFLALTSLLGGGDDVPASPSGSTAPSSTTAPSDR